MSLKEQFEQKLTKLILSYSLNENNNIVFYYQIYLLNTRNLWSKVNKANFGAAPERRGSIKSFKEYYFIRKSIQLRDGNCGKD